MDMGAAATYALAGLEVNLFNRKKHMVSKLNLGGSIPMLTRRCRGRKVWWYPATSLGVNVLLATGTRRAGCNVASVFGKVFTHNLTHTCGCGMCFEVEEARLQMEDGAKRAEVMERKRIGEGCLAVEMLSQTV